MDAGHGAAVPAVELALRDVEVRIAEAVADTARGACVRTWAAWYTWHCLLRERALSGQVWPRRGGMYCWRNWRQPKRHLPDGHPWEGRELHGGGRSLVLVKLAGTTVSLTPQAGGGPCMLAGARHSKPVQLPSSNRSASVFAQELCRCDHTCARSSTPDSATKWCFELTTVSSMREHESPRLAPTMTFCSTPLGAS